ncbi:MAG: NAD-dependent epimerase/dehydratase family protein [Alphaproteobacteria bacterium]
MKILCLGFGFCANGLWYDWQTKGKLDELRFFASWRDKDKKKLLQAKNITPLEMATDRLAKAMVDSDIWLVSAKPDNDGDAFLQHYGMVVEKWARQKYIIYLSTTGVYGDHGGAWVDETTLPNPQHTRSKQRWLAEKSWLRYQAVVLRLGGIYGPLLDGMGQNILQSIKNGTARRIEKSGQVFGRIHVFDIATAIALLIEKNIKGEVFNVVDDAPINPRLVVDYGFQLLGLPLPALEKFADAKHTMSSMAQSFFADNKRVKNDKIKNIGWQLQYPSYRQGIDMIYQWDKNRS